MLRVPARRAFYYTGAYAYVTRGIPPGLETDRFCDFLAFRRCAILAERFYFIETSSYEIKNTTNEFAAFLIRLSLL